MMAPEQEPVSVFLVEDQTLIRAAFRRVLQNDERFIVLGDTGDPRHGIQEIGRLKPDVVILDIAMPGLSGLDALPQIREISPKSRVVMLSHHEGEVFVRRALDAGATGYLSKDSEPEELFLALRTVVQGGTYLSPRVAGTVVAARSDAPSGAVSALTAREREVFLLLAIGKSNKEVATELDMSVGTAKKHRENLQRKLDCHSTAELARLAIREGLLDP
jgi:DNA-binding NarL/FixJ family response regulator